MEKRSHVNINQKKPRGATPMSDRVDFRAKTVTKGEDGPVLVKKEPVNQEDTTVPTISTSNN